MCSDDAECAPDHRCDVVQAHCVEPLACLDATTLQQVDGTHADCTPYVCDQGACRTACTETTQCAAGFDCRAGRCAERPTGSNAPGSGGGCGCRQVAARDPSVGLCLLLAAVGLGARGRRRRRG
jgi:hypothetical protein